MLKVCIILLVLFNAGQSFDFVQPERQIKCPPVDQLCEVTLRVAFTSTLTANGIVPGLPNSDGGTPVTINSTGGYEFDYGVSIGTSIKRIQPIDGDGITRRPLYSINYQVPGPTIVGYTNQRVRIKVINALLSESITFHWHGMHQIGTPHMDGTAYITQCPIIAKTEFTYEFKLFPEGTFWYHSHVASERSNGLYGALIVLPPQPDATSSLIDMLGAHTILIDEWFLVNSQEEQWSPIFSRDLLNPNVAYRKQPLRTYDGTHASVTPFIAGVINGAGWRYTPDGDSCRRLANTTLPSFQITQGNRYRFRVIGSQANHNMRLSVQGHRLRLIATDGSDTKIPDSLPQEVDYITVNVAERYDFIVEANQAVDNYVVLVETMENPYEMESRGYCVKAHRAYAVLRYEGAPTLLPDDFDSQYNPLERCNSTNQCYALNCPFMDYPDKFFTTCINFDKLELVKPQAVPNDDVSNTVFLNFYEKDGIVAINSKYFIAPSSPPLTQSDNIEKSLFCKYTQDLTNITSIYEFCTHTYTANTATVELVFSNLADQSLSSHPIHFHGHYFHVLHVGYPSYNANGTIARRNQDIKCTTGDGYCNSGVSWSNGGPPPSSCMESNTCPLKDTVTIPAGGYVRVRFARNNPGWWLLHCHIESHFLGGMALVINATSAPGDMNIPSNFPRCGDFTSATYNEPIKPPTTYQNVTTGLAIICSVLLLALIIVSTVLVLTCVRKKKVFEEDLVPLQKVNSKEDEQS